MEIREGKEAKKLIRKLPVHVYRKYLYWKDLLDSIGLRESRKYKGFHDEPLTGRRKGQRSVRLSKEFRAIYIEIDGSLEIIEVLEVNKHDY